MTEYCPLSTTFSIFSDLHGGVHDFNEIVLYGFHGEMMRIYDKPL
jgi:hypothetical protein